MKKLFILLISLLMLTSCRDEIETDSLYGFFEVKNPDQLDIPRDSVLVVRSLKEYKALTGKLAEQLPINFTKCNVLLVKGTSPNLISQMEYGFDRTHATLHVTVRESLATALQPWALLYAIDRDDCPDQVTLHVEYIKP